MLIGKNVVIVACVLALLLGLQVYLSLQENKWMGRILPILCALLSLIVPLNVAAAPGQPWREIVPIVVLSTLYANIPTAVLLAIYAACGKRRRKRRLLDKMNIQDL